MGAYPFDGRGKPMEQQIKNPELNFTSPVTGGSPSLPAQNLIRSLIRVQPKDRLSLVQCSQDPWAAAGDAVPASGNTTEEFCAMLLPTRPTRKQRDEMVKDL